MSLLRVISRQADERRLPFMLIGGYAVMAHGFVRTTGDIDFLIQKSRACDWQIFLEDLKFTVQFSGPTFLQFNPPPGEKLPVDLMFVDNDIFDQMLSMAASVEADGILASVVSLPHLFALKCHAFQSRPQRAMKDIEDLVQLTKINKLDLNEPAMRAILIKHGGQEFYEFLKRECGAIHPE